MSKLSYWLWLTNLRGMTPQRANAVLTHFGTPEGAYFADPGEYDLLPPSVQSIKSVLLDKSMDTVERILEDCQRLNLQILTLQDAQYPQRLRRIPDPPLVLYVKGRILPIDEEVTVAMVGSRTPSLYGIYAAERLGLELAKHGALVVSGIAMGLDSAALRGALKGGGQVISMLAGGIDIVYPKMHQYLYEDVAAAGALMSEYPPGTEHRANHYLPRNRIISGLSLAVVAVECTWHSGTMLTVNWALEQDRDVFAVPGNIDAAMSEGPNRLIQQGAGLVRCGWDIVGGYLPQFPGKLRENPGLTPHVTEARIGTPPKPQSGQASSATEKKIIDKPPERAYIVLEKEKAGLSDDQADVLKALEGRDRVADDLIEHTQIPTKRVLSALTILQVMGYVEEKPGGYFSALARLAEVGL